MAAAQIRILVGSWHLLAQRMAFGNPTAGGFQTMAEALHQVALLNEKLSDKYPGLELAVSAHWWHELLVPTNAKLIGGSAVFNNPRAISLDDWADGYQSGYYPPIGRIIPPGFGLPGSDDGAFIHHDAARRELAHNMLVYSFQCSEEVKEFDYGLGDVIYWTGPDGIRWRRLVEGDDVLLGHKLNPQLEEWQLIVNGVGGALKDAHKRGYRNTRLLVEGKPAGDPCYLDVFTDTVLEIEGIKAINTIADARIASWQGEFCHTRGSGQSFASALQQVVKAGVFTGQIHFNAGGLGAVSFTQLLSVDGGTPMSKFPQYVDNDFLPGEGVAEWLEDQRKSLEIGLGWSSVTGQPLEVEFDARFARYPNTIERLERSVDWVMGVFEEYDS